MAANNQKSLWERMKIWLLKRLSIVRQTMNNWLHAPNICNTSFQNFRLPLTYRKTNNWKIYVSFYFFVCTGVKFGLPSEKPTQMQSPTDWVCQRTKCWGKTNNHQYATDVFPLSLNTSNTHDVSKAAAFEKFWASSLSSGRSTRNFSLSGGGEGGR